MLLLESLEPAAAESAAAARRVSMAAWGAALQIVSVPAFAAA